MSVDDQSEFELVTGAFRLAGIDYYTLSNEDGFHVLLLGTALEFDKDGKFVEQSNVNIKSLRDDE